ILDSLDEHLEEVGFYQVAYAFDGNVFSGILGQFEREKRVRPIVGAEAVALVSRWNRHDAVAPVQLFGGLIAVEERRPLGIVVAVCFQSRAKECDEHPASRNNQQQQCNGETTARVRGLTSPTG